MCGIRSFFPSIENRTSLPDSVIAGAIARAENLWFPGLAQKLVHSLYPSSERRDHYGTARWLRKDLTVDREELASFILKGDRIVVEQLTLSDQARFGDVGFASSFTVEDTETFKSALAISTELPSLSKTLSVLVRSVHLLKAQRCYDVSYSHPELPLSIFVSVPHCEEPDAAVRLFESIVHEAMHLQLSLIEREVPLVAIEGSTYSPWKQTARPGQGVLHGLYVFAVIHQALEQLSRSDRRVRGYAANRLSEIRSEIEMLEDIQALLTPAGRLLQLRLRNAVGR